MKLTKIISAIFAIVAIQSPAQAFELSGSAHVSRTTISGDSYKYTTDVAALSVATPPLVSFGPTNVAAQIDLSVSKIDWEDGYFSTTTAVIGHFTAELAPDLYLGVYAGNERYDTFDHKVGGFETRFSLGAVSVEAFITRWTDGTTADGNLNSIAVTIPVSDAGWSTLIRHAMFDRDNDSYYLVNMAGVQKKFKNGLLFTAEVGQELTSLGGKTERLGLNLKKSFSGGNIFGPRDLINNLGF